MIDALRPAFLIVRREVRDQFRDWRIILPVIGLSIVFPFIMNWTAQRMVGFVREYGANIIADRLVPFLLMVVGFFPISVSLVIALESFVGEKERSSIEPLLNSPLKDWQLYLGKLISSTVPPLLSSYLGMIVYLVGLLITRIPWPPLEILLQIVILTTAQAVLMVSGAVVVSTQATSVRAANLLSSFIIIPVAFLIQWEALVMFWGNESTLWWVSLGVIVMTALLVRIGLAHFQREELLGREIDVLRIKWAWKTFRQGFTGDARSVSEWYRSVLPRTLRSMGLPVLLVAGLLAAGILIGLAQVERFPFLIDASRLNDAGRNLNDLLRIWPVFRIEGAVAVFWQNLRVLLLAAVLGIFSFGVLGVMPLLATVAVAGYLVGLLSTAGIPIWQMVALLAPHGVLEIPAAMLATAAVLRSGAMLAAPTPGKTVGEVWLLSLADWARVMAGVVAPALVVAALIEVLVTPRIALMIFGG